MIDLYPLLFLFTVTFTVGQTTAQLPPGPGGIQPIAPQLPPKFEVAPANGSAMPQPMSPPPAQPGIGQPVDMQPPPMQQPAMQPPPVQQPGMQPPDMQRPSIPQPPVAQPAANTGIPVAATETIRMQYPNADVKEVLALYERLTQKKLVFDNTVQGQVNIIISTPVSKSDAIKIIEINLLLNGFSLVPASDPSILKVIGANKNARSAGLPILSDMDQLPEGERVVTFVFKLRYADPEEMRGILAQYITQGASTSLLALPKSQMLLVTENTSVLRGLARIIHEIDIPPAEVISEFIPLERADAKDVIEKLEKIFEKKEVQGTAAAAGHAPAAQSPIIPPANPEGNAPSVEIPARMLSEDSVVIGKIKLTADIRTNRIHVITRPANIPFVRKLIREFDSDVPFGEPAKRPLRYVSASDVLGILVKSITEPGMKSEDTAGGSSQKSSNNNNQNNGNNSNGNNGSGGSLNVSEELTAQAVDTTPKAVTIGNTKIIADPRENTIIVLGNKEVRQKIFRLLDEIDVRAPQVTLNTVIGEFSINDDLNLGVDYLLRPHNLNTTGTSGVALLAASRWAMTQFTGAGVLSNAASTLGAGSGATGVISATSNLDIIVNALESTGRFRVTNRPMIVARNTEKASVASGEQIAVPTSTLSNVNTGTTINNTASVSASVQYQPVELKLEVVPLINADREVSLDIVQKLDSDSGKTTNVGGSLIPTITTRYIKTKVSVPDRCTVVLGGLIKKSTLDGAGGVPLLSKIPVLGYLFKNTTKNNDREELIILIRPEVMKSPAEQVKNSQDEQRHLMIEPNVESTLQSPTPTPKPVKFRK